MENFELPPAPRPTHKTKGLSRTQYRTLLSPVEAVKNDKARATINGDMSWLTGGTVGIDDGIDIDAYPFLAVFAGFKYRDILRTAFKAYDDAEQAGGGIDVDNPTAIVGINLQLLVGLLDSPASIDRVNAGIPL